LATGDRNRPDFSFGFILYRVASCSVYGVMQIWNEVFVNLYMAIRKDRLMAILSFKEYSIVGPPVALISKVAKKFVDFFCFSRFGQKNFMF